MFVLAVILVHLRATWPLVQAGDLTPSDATLGNWSDLNDDRLREYADALLGIYQNTVVTTYDVTGWTRNAEGKVIFDGLPSQRWASLIGTPNPGKPWVRGMARPVQYVDTRVVLAETAAAEPEHRRATVGGFTLAIGDGNSAVVTAPPGATVLVQPSTQPAEELAGLARAAAWGLMKGGHLDAGSDGKRALLERLEILEAARRAGIGIDLHGEG